MATDSRSGLRGPVTRADIEAKLRQIKGEVDSAVGSTKPYALIAVAVGGLALVGLTYALGLRRGKKKTTVVEVKRV
jgi:hypothetical protein